MSVKEDAATLLRAEGRWAIDEAITMLESATSEKGLKDHEIRELVNALNNELRANLIGYKLPQCLRVMISSIVVKFLIENKLKID